MFSRRPNPAASVTTAALIAAIAVFPASIGVAAERTAIPTLPYELEGIAPASTVEDAALDKPLPALSSVDPADQRCMAKVVHHEAGNQPRAGMIAVAQTLLNRMKAGGRFGGTICAVARQPGQYFNINAYHPDEDSDRWQTAMAVARDTLSGKIDDAVAPGALFFRAAYHPASTFFRSRERVATVGDQIFYR